MRVALVPLCAVLVAASSCATSPASSSTASTSSSSSSPTSAAGVRRFAVRDFALDVPAGWAATATNDGATLTNGAFVARVAVTTTTACDDAGAKAALEAEARAAAEALRVAGATDVGEPSRSFAVHLPVGDRTTRPDRMLIGPAAAEHVLERHSLCGLKSADGRDGELVIVAQGPKPAFDASFEQLQAATKTLTFVGWSLR